MAIVSSSFVVGVAQRDGRCYVTETHVDNAGIAHVVGYGPVPVIDYQAHLTANATQLGVQLADDEAEAVFASGWSPPVYQTGAELAARFRAKYLNASDIGCARLAYWIIERINAGNFTDAQVRTAFGLTATQYTAMKTRMTTLHDQWVAILAARGE